MVRVVDTLRKDVTTVFHQVDMVCNGVVLLR